MIIRSSIIHTLLVLFCFVSLVNCFWPFSSKAKEKRQLSPFPAPVRYNDSKRSPVIFIPGDGGSQLWAQLNKDSAPNFYCQKQSKWYNLWLNLQQLVIPIVYCWVDNLKLYYDNVTRTTHNTPGVETQVPGWGDTEVVEWIDPTHNKAGAYFKDIVLVLEELGYVRRKNIHAAPYDFRKAPNEQKQYFIDLKKLVEDTYEANDKTPVTFISHSMGSPMALVFLQQQTLDWKRKYVRRQISLAGAWAGSMKAIKVYAMGDNLDSIILSSKILREEQITNPSTAWLLPSPLFWKSSEVLVETPSRKYTMSQLKDFFDDIDYPNGWEMRKDTLQYTINFSPPDVELHCIYGTGLKTVEKLRYKKDVMSGEPELVMGLGDGTVNDRSLRACHHWMGYTSAKISTLELNGVSHMGILAQLDVYNYIKRVLEMKPSTAIHE